MENFIKKTIKKAGDATMNFFGRKEIEYTKKTPHEVVTKADLVSQKIIVDAVKNTYPNHGIISEEMEPHQSNAEYIWYIDPLDGTRNFASKVPLFGINIGLAHNNEIIYGAIYLPATKELCFAEKDKGVYLNNQKIQCSDQQDWELSYGIGPIRISSPKGIKFINGLGRISNKKAWMNGIASPSISAVYIADGRRDWYISRGSKIWDYAAPSLIMKEAGCIVTNLQGEAWKLEDENLIVSNKYLHAKLLEISQ